MPAKTSTSAVGVNAAFLREVKDDNVMLHELLEAASKLLAPTERVMLEPRCLVDLFGRLRDQLAIHFALEEALGYLEDVIVQSPRLCEAAFALRAEHRELYLAISELAVEAEITRTDDSPFAKTLLLNRFRAFCRSLKDHELREDELIIDSLYDELGVGD